MAFENWNATPKLRYKEKTVTDEPTVWRSGPWGTKTIRILQQLFICYDSETTEYAEEWREIPVAKEDGSR